MNKEHIVHETISDWYQKGHVARNIYTIRFN